MSGRPEGPGGSLMARPLTRTQIGFLNCRSEAKLSHNVPSVANDKATFFYQQAALPAMTNDRPLGSMTLNFSATACFK